jgi:hypothetical protein
MRVVQCNMACFQRAVDVVEDADGLVRAPAQAAGEEGQEEEDAVVELDFRTGEIEFVAEPVDV